MEFTRRDHSFIACSRHIYIVVLRAHPVRGESHIQHNATGEVATTFYLNLGKGFVSRQKLFRPDCCLSSKFAFDVFF